MGLHRALVELLPVLNLVAPYSSLQQPPCQPFDSRRSGSGWPRLSDRRREDDSHQVFGYVGRDALSFTIRESVKSKV